MGHQFDPPNDSVMHHHPLTLRAPGQVVDEAFELSMEPAESNGTQETQVAGFCGWFDVHFRVSHPTPCAPCASPLQTPPRPTLPSALFESRT
eukprot:1191938-Prorocentrum_minimum.AAC.11